MSRNLELLPIRASLAMRKRKATQPKNARLLWGRSLRIEPLEDRRMLATIVVNSLADNLTADGQITLREAILAANNDAVADAVEGTQAGSGADVIEFDPALSGGTILLTSGELQITKELSIHAAALAQNITINANQLSRIFNIDDPSITTENFNVALSGLTLTGGKTTANEIAGRGGAIRSLTSGSLAISESTVSGNRTLGLSAYGGGVSAKGEVTLTHVTISGNVASSDGGGIFSAGPLVLTHSTISGNQTVNGSGGGIRCGDLSLTSSTVSGNSAGAGYYNIGGGITAFGTVTLTNSVVSGNTVVGKFSYGGGIQVFGNLTMVNSSVTGNSTGGYAGFGGGIVASTAMLINSTVTGNSTAQYRAPGGGFWAGAVTLNQSTVSGNWTNSELSGGGGIRGTVVTLNQSTVSGNRTADGGDGGGIFALVSVALNQSTVSGNSILGGEWGFGGGIYSRGSVVLNQSTVSGNTTSAQSAAGYDSGGGGIFARGAVTLNHSTLTDNHATHATGVVGGIYQFNEATNPPVNINHSIVSGNTAGTGNPNVKLDPQSSLTANFSLIGTSVSPTAGGNNVASDAPLLKPLAFNGGPTQTHALHPGSPALDMGNPAAIAGELGVPDFDQRGAPWTRVAGGRIDIGAFESQPNPLPGDYNLEGAVNAADYTLWRDTLGSGTYLQADGDESGGVNGPDYGVWAANFGAPEGGGASSEERGASNSLAGGSPAIVRSMGDSPVRDVQTIFRDSDGAVPHPTGEQARMLALLDLLDSLPKRELESIPTNWDFMADEESEPAAREKAFTSYFAAEWP